MDDVLICASTKSYSDAALSKTVAAVESAGFQIAQEKIQLWSPWKYLGFLITGRTVVPQTLSINEHPQTLRDTQQLCGVITWIRPLLGLTTEELAPLFDLLRGDGDLASPRSLTPEAWEALERVASAIKHRQAHWTDRSLPLSLGIFGTAPEALQERYRLGSLLGRGGFGSVFAATRLSDGAPVAIKRVPRNRVRHWGELPDGSRAPLEIVLQAKVSTGFPGVVQLLEWFELPNHIVMVMERPERCQDLQRFIEARQFLPEEVARELFRQVLEAVRHCTSCGVLHRDIKPQNIVLDLATGQAKLIDFGCGTYLQETAYTHFAGTPSYSPPEWNDFGWYHGEAATIWSLGILLHQMVCGEHPFRRGRNLSWGQLPLPQGLSQECKDLIRWCLSVNSLERPTLEDLFCDPWVQDIPRP
ncbi:serine/threonine-protein kinase pim-1-like [Agelaius phoeniceus]|uniref:serine/threonine-protein kinase pim-1-like n=1 Tax=Agelaius phoeniceus TaxID=39638 RepID=UPI00405535D3